MSAGGEQASGWLISGFFAQVVLWAWVGIVVLYGLYRSLADPAPDPIRPAGPGVG